MSVLALVVTHQPGDALRGLVGTLRAAGLRVLVVDNASTQGLAHLEWCVDAKARVVRLPENTGVGGGLAQGLAAVTAATDEWLLTFDQDSRVAPEALAALLGSAHLREPRVAMVGPVVVVDGAHERVLQPAGERAALITSGAVCRVAALTQVGGFRPELFIDFVDHDLCLRLRRAGWTVCVEPAAVLRHSLGNWQEHRVAGVPVRSTHHSPDRLYYRYRNFVLLARDGTLGADRAWAWRVGVALGWAPLKVLAVESDRRRALAAIAAGVRDGLRRRTGPRPAARSPRRPPRPH